MVKFGIGLLAISALRYAIFRQNGTDEVGENTREVMERLKRMKRELEREK